MCGRFVMTISSDQLHKQFDVAEVPELTPRYNIAPTQQILAVCQNGDGYRHLKSFRWGLIPHWAKDSSSCGQIINARCESVAEKPSFRGPIRFHRCLIPASGFIEWQKSPAGKTPYYIRRIDKAPMAFAAIWDSWQDSGSVIDSCAILTTNANLLVAPLHDRMPVILSPTEYKLWLDRNCTDPEQLKGLYTSFPTDPLQAIPLGPLINNSRHDNPDCLIPLHG